MPACTLQFESSAICSNGNPKPMQQVFFLFFSLRKKNQKKIVFTNALCVCVCVCVRERERERDRDRAQTCI